MFNEHMNMIHSINDFHWQINMLVPCFQYRSDVTIMFMP